MFGLVSLESNPRWHRPCLKNDIRDQNLLCFRGPPERAHGYSLCFYENVDKSIP